MACSIFDFIKTHVWTSATIPLLVLADLLCFDSWPLFGPLTRFTEIEKERKLLYLVHFYRLSCFKSIKSKRRDEWNWTREASKWSQSANQANCAKQNVVCYPNVDWKFQSKQTWTNQTVIRALLCLKNAKTMNLQFGLIKKLTCEPIRFLVLQPEK